MIHLCPYVDREAQAGEDLQIEPDGDLVAQPAPDYGVDQPDKW